MDAFLLIMTCHAVLPQVFVLRKRATHAVPKPGVRFYFISLSSTTIVYKGQLTSEQVWTYFLDLKVSPDGCEDGGA